MSENECVKIGEIEGKICSVGIDLALIDSLIKFMDIALNDKLDITNADMANWVVILKRLVKIVKSKYEKIENVLNV